MVNQHDTTEFGSEASQAKNKVNTQPIKDDLLSEIEEVLTNRNDDSARKLGTLLELNNENGFETIAEENKDDVTKHPHSLN